MNKLRSHDRTANRTFIGAAEADWVVGWLNGRTDEKWSRSSAAKASKDRVLLVISSIRKLLALSESGVSAGFQDVNLLLARYKTFSLFYPDQLTGKGWRVGDAVLDGRPIGESRAVHAAVELTRQGRLDRLKTCSCGLWYFAKFSHQKFCSEECRLKFWENSEERIAQKRARSREYYEYHKVHARKQVAKKKGSGQV
jgi:hypothetical protein